MTGAAFERSGGPAVVSPRDEQRQVTTVEEWLEWAGPLRGERQWADGRSAKEVAKAWCRADGTIAVPPDLQALLDSNPTLGAFRAATVIPELPTALGDVPRGARRHDLSSSASTRQGDRRWSGSRRRQTSRSTLRCRCDSRPRTPRPPPPRPRSARTEAP